MWSACVAPSWTTLAIADVIHAAAFFNWANRLILSLGEPAAAVGDSARAARASQSEVAIVDRAR